MVRSLKLIAGVFAFAALAVSAAEIPPFYPPAAPKVPRGTAIKPGEIKITLPGGVEVEPGKFNSSRSLNGNWKFSGLEKAEKAFEENPQGFEAVEFDDSKWDTIAVPLNWYQKYKNFYDQKKSFVQGYYRHSFELTPAELKNQRVLLHFKFIGYEGILWINGKRVGSHHGDFVPWTVDVTDFVKPGRNQLMMQVITDFGPARGAVKKATRTYGSQWSWSNIKGGIWGDVELRFEPVVRFTQLYVVPNLADDSVTVRAKVDNTTGSPVEAAFTVAVSTALKKDANHLNAAGSPEKVVLKPGLNVLEQRVSLKEPVWWSPDNPYLYFATALLEADGKVISARPVRFGFREFRIKDGKFHLNGERIFLFGENIPSVMYGGYSGRSSEKEAENLYRHLAGFKSLGYNIIRNAHMPIMEEALEIADEIGMMFYDEWGWSFTKVIDEPEFQKNNDQEFLAWLDRDFNHPSVVMWSCGNEVRHSNSPDIRRQLDRQVTLMREHDLQKRPAGSFSGSACWRGYGTERLVTDFIDHHTYLGNGEAPWTNWFNTFNEYYAGSLEQYDQKTAQLDMPYIIWEIVGFSWGDRADRNFKPNDTQAYAAYVKKPTTWAQPNGVGYIGCLGLAAALDPDRGNDYGKRIYGHRLLELLRQDLRVDGFAPWFHGSGLDAATLWTQPVYVGLRTADGLPPRNFFSDKPIELELFVSNSCAKPFSGGELVVTFQLSKEKSVKAGSFKVGGTAPFTLYTAPVKFSIPAGVLGNVQMRLELFADGKSVSRNFYPVFIGDAAELAKPVSSGSTVALLDVGNKADIASTAAILDGYGIKYDVVNSNSIPKEYRVAVIPAALENRAQIRINREAAFKWIEDGGTLIILEQGTGSGSLFGDTALVAAPNTLVDLVHPAHPVFKGLTPRNFDTWVNPEDHGYAINVTLSPFINNALATRGSMTGSVGVDNAIVEATFGKGRIFWSQVNAVKLNKVDSVATTYLRNLFDYILNGKMYDKVLPLDPSRSRGSEIDPARLEVIDLAPYVNRSFSDEKDNDGKGGWTDQGNNDFRNMPLGKQVAAGVTFEIIDPAKNDGKSCIVLRGSERPNFPSEVTGIKVGKKFSRLFFLHTAAWSSGDVGVYRINYADGSSVDYPLKHGINIGDWWNTTYLTQAAPGIMRENPTKPQVGTYVASWENPHPDKEIKSIDFLASSSPLVKTIDFLPSKNAVPVLVAITGEKAHPAPIAIDDARRAPAGSGLNPKSKAKIAKMETVLPDGTDGPAWRIDMPGSEGGAPYVLFWFDVKGKKLADYNYLTLWVKPESAGAVDLRLPETDWKGALDKSVELSGNGWQRIRVDLNLAGKKKFLADGKELRGELFLFNGQNKGFLYPRKPVKFLMTGAMLE